MKNIAKTITVLLALAFVPFLQAETFEELSGQLSKGSYSKKAKTLEALAEMNDPRVLPLFISMLDARLYVQKSDGRLFIIDTSDSRDTTAISVNTGELLGSVDKDDLKKIRINNRIRRVLRPRIAVLQLKSEDVATRLSAAKEIATKADESLREVIVGFIDTESSKKVKTALQLAVAMIDVNSDDQKRRFLATNILGDSVEPEAVGALRALTEKNSDGEYIDSNLELVELATKKLRSAESKVSLFKFFENIIFGFSLGSILLLAAIGLAITFGVMGVINMAHGEMIMLGAYTTFAIQQIFPTMTEWSLLMAIPAAFLVSGMAGVLIERLVIRHLYGRALDTLLATFGISLILQQAVRMYSSNNVAVITPEWLSGFYSVNGAMAITYNRIYILIFSLLVLGLLALVLKKTLVGLQMRAVTQNRAMANSMGIRSGWVDAMTFGLGSGIAGIAGVALSQITNVGPNLGQGYIIDSFMVVVFGGVGNLMGTFFGAMTLGLANKLLEPWAGAVVGKIIVLVFIILFIQWRPRGLFALKGRFVED